MKDNEDIKQKEYRPMPLNKLRRMFQIVEKGLGRYLSPALKQNKFFTVKELEMFLELGHTSKDFHNLMEEHKKV